VARQHFRYLETGAGPRFWTAIGYNYRQMVTQAPLAGRRRAPFKYIRPTTFGQRLRVTRRSRNMRIVEDRHNHHGRGPPGRVTEATTTQVAVHRELGEMSFVSPPALIDKVKAALTR